jgi:glycosyltransferase involved in cell wall biosynthesis
MVKPLVCWVLTALVPYHDARLGAVLNRGDLQVCVIALTDTDVFRALEHRGSTGYERLTLFRGVAPEAINGAAMAPRLTGMLDHVQPDVVAINGWSFGGCHAALEWSLIHRRPVILMSDSAEADAPRRAWKERVKARIVRLCSSGMVAGDPHARYLANLGLPAERIFQGYDVVDNAYFSGGADAARRDAPRLRQELELPERYFLASSRFEPKKNLFGLLDAYARYRTQAATPWSLVILGDGELREKLLAHCGTMGLVGDVYFPGFRAYTELPAYYGLAKAFVHASTVEQWGLVVNEAMAAGLPVIVSNRCGCAPDLVDHQRNGFLFDPFDTDALAKLLLRVSANDGDRAAMGAASQAIISRWSPETFAANLTRAVMAALSASLPRPGTLDRILLRMLRAR